MLGRAAALGWNHFCEICKEAEYDGVTISGNKEGVRNVLTAW